MSDYFCRRYKRFDGDVSVKVDLSNYATKTDLKNVSHVDVNTFAPQSNLASLKTEVDKIDAGKLKTVPIDLAKLSYVVKNDVMKKIEYNKLVTKVDNINTKNFFSRTKSEKYGTDFEDKIDKIDKKIPDVTNLVKKADFNTKVTEIEGKIPDAKSLATKPDLTVVENKIPDVSSLVKKTDFNTKVTELEGKIPSITGLVTNSELFAVENKIPDVSSLVEKTNLNAEFKKN